MLSLILSMLIPVNHVIIISETVICVHPFFFMLHKIFSPRTP